MKQELDQFVGFFFPFLFTLKNLQLYCGNSMQINSLAFQVNTSHFLPNGGRSGLYLSLFPKPLLNNLMGEEREKLRKMSLK